MKQLGEVTLNEIKDRCEEHLSLGADCQSCPFWVFCMPEGMSEKSPTCWGTELVEEMEV